MDDQQIGGGSGEAMGQTSAQSADNSGPLDQRIVSKNWSVRAGAYDELLTLCKNDQPKCKKDHYSQFCDQWKVYLKDSNPGALEKALDCLLVFLDKIHSSILVPSQNSIINLLVEKCLCHAKPMIKSKSQQCLLLIFEVGENFDESMDTFNELLKHKNIKVLTSGTQAVALLVEHFGVKKVKIANYAESMLKNAQNTNPGCKNAAYDYYKAVYKWIGDAILPQIEDKLKKSQIDDLKKAFEEVKAKGNKDKKLTRTEAAQAKEAAQDAAIEAQIQEESKQEEVIDALEFAPEVDVLKKFEQEWIDTTAAIKPWQEKVAKLNEITEACKNVKVKPGNVENLAAFLKKEIGGTNINIGMAAMDAGTALAKGMRENFKNGTKELIGVFLLKYKEKRPMVIEKLKAFLEAAVTSANFEDMSANIIPCLTNAAPGVQKGAVEFVEKVTLLTYIDVLKRIAPELMPPMIKQLDAKDGGVRDSALHCMGILKGRLGDDFPKYLKEGAVNAQKTAKIEEASKEVKPSKYDRPENYKPPKPKAKPVEKKEDAAMDGGDELMNFDMGPPKKKPPNIGKKPPSRKDKQKLEDEEMKNEEEPKKAAPPKLSSDKPKTAAKPTKAPTAPVIVDENLGEGMTKEQAIEKVQGHFSNTDKFDSAKWQDKQEGFQSMQEQIKSETPDTEMLEAVSKFIKAKMKDFKESNINLMKEIVNTFSVIAQSCDAINKRTFQVGMQFFVEKIGDIKMSTQIKEMLLFAAEKVSPKYISLQTIKYGSTTKAPKNIQESCVLLVTICDDFGVSGIPMQETIGFAKLAAAHATPAVRQAANKLFCELFRHAGEAIRNFMDDIKESTLKVIDGELSKITQYAKGEHEKKRFWIGAKQAQPGPDGKPGKVEDDDDPFKDLPREDISKKLTTKLLEQFGHKDWKIRKKGGEDVEAILKEAKMRIEDKGLNGLLDALKNGMKDANKAVLKIFISLIGQLAVAVDTPIKAYTKKVFVPMIKHLAYKDTLVRAETVSTMTKWAEVIGAEHVINKISVELSIENPESRTEGLNWIQKNKAAIKNADKSSMVKPFIQCLTDKSKGIRDQTEALICEFMPLVGYSEFSAATKDFKPAVQQTLKPILERIKANSGSQNQPIKEGQAPVQKPKVVEEEEKVEPVQNFKPSFQRDEPTDAKKVPEKKPAPVVEDKKPQATMDSARGPRKPAVVENDDEIQIQANAKQKQKRSDLDSRTKYPLNEVKGDHVEKLQNQCSDAFGLKFHDEMFAKSQDFKKHIACVEQISKFVDSQYDQLMLIIDVVFKWGNLRMTESSNTQLAVSILDFYKKLLTKMIDLEQQFQEFEILVLLGTLCDKSGVNNKSLQQSTRQLIRMCYELYEKKQCLRIIIDTGVKNKNLKSAAECLDEMADYIANNGADPVMKKDYKLLIEMADNKDKAIRENSLKVFAEIYTLLGKKIWTHLKDVPSKVKGLLEQRFLVVDKRINRPGGLTDSLNPNKNPKEELVFNKPGFNNRQSIAPGLSGSLGGIKGLKFNKDKTPTKKKDDEEIVNQLEEMDPFNQKMKNVEPSEPQQLDQDMQDESKPNTQMIDFTGKARNDDEVMHGDDDFEDGVDVVATPIQARGIKNSGIAAAAPNAMNEDDELIQKHLIDAERSLESDPALRDQKVFILSHIKQLRDGDLLKRVDSLVLLNEVISATSAQNQAEQPNMSQELLNQQKALIHCCNDLINAFTHVMDDIFKHPVQDIPLRFTKYFITIVNKTCTSKEIMTEVSEKSVHDLVEQLLTRLLIDNLDKIGQNKEGELILKNLNSSMIRMLENCNHTYVFGVLFKLLKKFQFDNSLPKMHGLIIKCLLKLNKIMHRLIEKLDMQKFLLFIHEYLVIIDHNNRSQNDDLGIRIVKTLINEIVKLKEDKIWESYDIIQQHPKQDDHIKKWIEIILKSLKIKPTQQTDQPRSATVTEFEFKRILMELRDPAKYDNAIMRLAKFAQNYPQYNYQEKLSKEQSFFANKVLNSLEQFKNSNSWKSTNNSDSLGVQAQQPQDNQNDNSRPQTQAELNRSLGQKSAFESKMAKFKRQSTTNIPGSNTIRNTTTNVPGQNNLNSSFSVMNQKIADRWDKMKDKKINPGGQTVRQSLPQTNLSQTMNANVVNQLNTSNNKFQSKFASKIQQQKQAQNPDQANTSLGGNSSNAFQSQTNMNQAAQQQNNSIGGAPKSQRIGGGISSNSFRSRLQGLGSAQQNQGGGLNAQTSVPQVNSQGSSGAATHQDLKQRLDQMKMKMQALKKDK